MEPFSYLEHTADMKIRAYGRTLAERFANAARAVVSLVHNPSTVEPKKQKHVHIVADDVQSLLYKWIDEIVFLMDAEFFFVNTVTVTSLIANETCELHATITGDNTEGKYRSRTGVKAMTYAEMEVTDTYLQFVVDL